MQNSILRLPNVIKITGLSRSSIYNLLAAGDFPKQIQLTPRSIGFLESEVQDWIQKKAKNRAQ